MHDIKFIKENRTDFEESMKKRNLKIDVSKLIDVHNSYLNFLNKATAILTPQHARKWKWMEKLTFLRFKFSLSGLVWKISPREKVWVGWEGKEGFKVTASKILWP